MRVVGKPGFRSSTVLEKYNYITIRLWFQLNILYHWWLKRTSKNNTPSLNSKQAHHAFSTFWYFVFGKRQVISPFLLLDIQYAVWWRKVPILSVVAVDVKAMFAPGFRSMTDWQWGRYFSVQVNPCLSLETHPDIILPLPSSWSRK